MNLIFNENHVGEKVWSPVHGNGIIKEFRSDSEYSVLVKFDNDGWLYKRDGVYYRSELRTLYFGHDLKIVDEVIPCIFKKGDRVWVRDDSDKTWKFRIFHGRSVNGGYYAYMDIQSINNIKLNAECINWDQCVPFYDMPMG